jgi:predicted nucleic acid-binding protein
LSYLLDTNVLSELRRREPDAQVVRWLDLRPPSTLFLSVLTLGELRKGVEALPAGARRQALDDWLAVDLPAYFGGRILPIDARVADRWGADLRRQCPPSLPPPPPTPNPPSASSRAWSPSSSGRACTPAPTTRCTSSRRCSTTPPTRRWPALAKSIAVTLHADGSVSVDDDGRGIPFGLHPEEKAPVVEMVFTRLHAGGKFDKGAGGAYSFSGGLHGVGVSVTNALAKRLEVTVWREGQVATLAFAGGDVIEPLVLRKAAGRRPQAGHAVRVWPDAKYFESAELPRHELTHLLRSKAVLMPGVTVTLVNEKTKDTQTWQYKGGLRDYLQQSLAATR